MAKYEIHCGCSDCTEMIIEMEADGHEWDGANLKLGGTVSVYGRVGAVYCDEEQVPLDLGVTFVDLTPEQVARLFSVVREMRGAPLVTA